MWSSILGIFKGLLDVVGLVRDRNKDLNSEEMKEALKAKRAQQQHEKHIEAVAKNDLERIRRDAAD